MIIIVDEAQNLPDETLEELRLLSNLETEKEKLLQIIPGRPARIKEKTPFRKPETIEPEGNHKDDLNALNKG